MTSKESQINKEVKSNEKIDENVTQPNETKVIENSSEKIKEHKKSIKKDFQCEDCNEVFRIYSELERHIWTVHPKDKYQFYWSQMDWTKYSGSSYYRDDPYY